MRDIGSSLLDHLSGPGTTICDLLKIRSKDGRFYGVTNHDREIEYNDGGADILYHPLGDVGGMKQHTTLEVDNAEAQILLDLTGIFTKEEINAGVLDFGKYWHYRINWQRPQDGHYLVSYGYTGQVTAEDQLSGRLELRGLAQRLKQTLVEQYSVTCRAAFGTSAGQVLFPCNFPEASLWQAGTVLTVDEDEPDRVFTAAYSDATGPNGVIPYEVALIQWQSGANAGAYIETEYAEQGGGAVNLLLGAPYPIQIGDSFRIRPDCAKRAKEDCINRFDNYENFRGEHTIPITEERSSSMPGANVPGVGTGIVPGLDEN